MPSVTAGDRRRWQPRDKGRGRVRNMRRHGMRRAQHAVLRNASCVARSATECVVRKTKCYGMRHVEHAAPHIPRRWQAGRTRGHTRHREERAAGEN
eukprot:365200-Chlamydomonas_euryale.AAC.4